MSNVSPEANDMKRRLEVDTSNVLVKDSEASILEVVNSGVYDAGDVTPSDSEETEMEGEEPNVDQGQASNLQATFLAHNVFEEMSQPYSEATTRRGEADPKDSEVLDTNHIDGVNLYEGLDKERPSHTQSQAWSEALFRDPVASQSLGKPSWADIAGNRDKYNNPNQPKPSWADIS
ncbi:hypothetical protein U1Q18_009977 [Sarracenia purpurea var. burkii]